MRLKRLAMATTVAALAALLVSITQAEEPKKLKYPDTKKGDVVDDYHGTKVADPYRWLEDDVRKSKDVADWVEAENKVTNAYLEAIPEREAIKKRITELWNYEKISRPVQGTAAATSSSRTTACRTRTCCTCRTRSTAKPKMLIDPNTWSKDGTVALAGLAVSDDGKLLAYGIAEAGSDWNTWKVLDVADGQDADRRAEVGEVQRRVVDEGRQGLLLQPLPGAGEGRRVPEPERGPEALLPQARHAADAKTCSSTSGTDNPKWTVGGGVTEDGKYLVISIGDGTTSRKVPHRVIRT